MKLDVFDIGTVELNFHSSTYIRVTGSLSLLWDGRLYSFDGAMAKHGKGFYLASGHTLTGQSGQKAPKKADDPISEAVSDAVNSYIADHPDVITEIEAGERERRIRNLKNDLKSMVTGIEKYQKNIQDIRAELRSLGEDA